MKRSNNKDFNWYPFLWLILVPFGLVIYNEMPALSISLCVSGFYFFTVCSLLGISMEVMTK